MSQTQPTADTPVPSWLKFPTHERVLEPEDTGFSAQFNETFSKLKVLAQAGTAAERARAQLAIKAYANTLEMLEAIRAARNPSSSAQQQPERKGR